MSLRDGRRAALDYLLEIGTPSIWHHRPLSGLLRVGEAVVVHERFHAIRSGSVVISVGISDGLGLVPEPEDELLRKPDGPVVVDLGSGVGEAITGTTRRWSMSRR